MTGVEALLCRQQAAGTEPTALLSVQLPAVAPGPSRPPGPHPTDEATEALRVKTLAGSYAACTEIHLCVTPGLGHTGSDLTPPLPL